MYRFKRPFIYSYFEKGYRKEAPQCTRRPKGGWVFTSILRINLEDKYIYLIRHFSV